MLLQSNVCVSILMTATLHASILYTNALHEVYACVMSSCIFISLVKKSNAIIFNQLSKSYHFNICSRLGLKMEFNTFRFTYNICNSILEVKVNLEHNISFRN